MAKVTLADVSNILGNPTSAQTTINNNSRLIEAAIENTLSRDGTTPNQMAADIDMNENDILNVGTLSTENLILNGQTVGTADVPLTILDEILDARDQAQAWAEGTEPGGPGTKSAKEWAELVQDGLIDGSVTDVKVASQVDPQLLIDGNKIKYTDGIDSYAVPLLTRERNWMWLTDNEGIVGDGVADDTVAFQAALDKASSQFKALLIPDNITIRLTAPIVNTSRLPVKIIGGGVEAYENNNYAANGVNQRGKGSWFYLDHTGKGFQFSGRTDGANTVGNTYIKIQGIGTFRNQPTPTTGWAPNNHDYDFDFTQVTADIDDLMLLNASRGLDWKTGRAGQLNVGKIRGQPLMVGIHVRNAYDVVRFSDVHFWPFWSLDNDVLAYTRNSADAVQLERCDGPMFDNLFTYGYSRSVLFSTYAGDGVNNPGGTTFHGSFNNIYSDLGQTAFSVGSTSDGLSVDIKRIIAEQATEVTAAAPSIFVAGTNAKITIGELVANNPNANIVSVTGTNSKVMISRAEPRVYNRSALGFPAFSATASGSEIVLSQVMSVWTGNGANLTAESGGGKVSGMVRMGVDTIPSGSPGKAVTHGMGTVPRGAICMLLDAGAQAAGSNIPRVSSALTNTTFTFDIGTNATANRPFSWWAFI